MNAQPGIAIATPVIDTHVEYPAAGLYGYLDGPSALSEHGFPDGWALPAD